MTEPRFIIKDGEHGPEYWEGDVRLAFINEQGTLQATRGNADRKPDIAAFIDWHDAHDRKEEPVVSAETISIAPIEEISEVPDGGQGEPDTGVLPHAGEGDADLVPHETKDSESKPVGSPELGEKDPAVISWHFKHDRKAAEKKYARCKQLWPI